MNKISSGVILCFFVNSLILAQGTISQLQDNNGIFATFGPLPTSISSKSVLIGSNSIKVKSFATGRNSLFLNPLGGMVGIGSLSPVGKLSINHNSSSTSPSIALSSSGVGNDHSPSIVFKNFGNSQVYQIVNERSPSGLNTFKLSSNDGTALWPVLSYRPDLNRVELNTGEANKITYTGELRVGVINGGQPFNILTDLKIEHNIVGAPNGSWNIGGSGGLAFVYNGVWVANIDFDGEFYEFSDRRYKTKIEPIQNAFIKILKLNPSTYYFKSNNFKKQSLGFIAQEVQQIIPEAVEYNEENDLFMMEYKDITVMTVAAIQERQKKIDMLKDSVDQKSEVLKLLNRELDRLEASYRSPDFESSNKLSKKL